MVTKKASLGEATALVEPVACARFGAAATLMARRTIVDQLGSGCGLTVAMMSAIAELQAALQHLSVKFTYESGKRQSTIIPWDDPRVQGR